MSVIVHVHWQVLITQRMPFMQSHDSTVNSSVLWGCKILNSRYVGHWLHAVFWVKSANVNIVFLNRGSCTPDPPEMHIPGLHVVSWIGWDWGGGLPVRNLGSDLVNNFRQGVLENPFVHVFNDLFLLISLVSLPSPFLPANPYLIVPIPQTNRRMMSQPKQIVSHFLLNISGNLAWVRVKGTGIHEVMPDQNTVLVTFEIKLILFKLTSSPESDHVKILLSCVLDHRFVGFCISVGETHFWWNVVAATTVNVNTV